ncbi:MAG: LTA synthase family protein [Saprospiraceae bacterium]|nr:LTA synthase family protein [Saprospiraceae bacterium]
MIKKHIKGTETCKSRYLGLTYFGLILVILFRVYESLTLYQLFNPPKLWKSEALGLMQDIFLCFGVFWIIYPIYRYLFDHRGRSKLYLFEIAVVFFVVAHIAILEYFFYQMEPLDVFLFGHKTNEMMFSLNTSGLSFKRLFIILLGSILLLTIGIYYYKRIQFTTKYFEILRWLGVAGLVLFIYLDLYGKFPAASDLIKNKSFYFYTNILKDRSKKFFEPSIEEWAPRYQQEFPDRKYIDPKFPFLHEFETDEKLGNYLQSFDKAPNVVILLTESLSEYFIHPIRGMHFMPFLDSLSKNSLYWPNHFSLGERSFAANPAISASVPYGEIGFSLMETYPYHFSLINVLQRNNYFCSFFYGQGAWFHNKKHFFNFNNIDRIIDKNSFSNKFKKIEVGEEKNFWGYNDIDLFEQYIESTDSLRNKTRLDIVFTGTSHSPFILNDPEYYNSRFQKDIEKITKPEDLEHFQLYKKYYQSLYNVDDAYRLLFDSLSKRSDYNNTIFIITGDHAMTELPRLNAINPYKVPLIIYSPKLKQVQRFEEICSHNDIYETLLSYLHNKYNITIPKFSSALGNKIKFEKEFNNKGTYAFMNNNRQIVDIYSDGYYLFRDKYLFKVYKDFELREIIDRDIRKKLRNKLYAFKAASQMACYNEALMPDSLYFNFTMHTIIKSHNYKDSIFFQTSDLVLDTLKIQNANHFTLDLSCTIQSEISAFPHVMIQAIDNEGKIIYNNELEFPYDKNNYQFHENIIIPGINSTYKLVLYFKNSAKDAFQFQDLKWTLYSK